uniref:Uncharacterized protein n=1 Tax=Physcomitrium patens TaxID=3218 RepID=A0A2K1IIW2_PHYPA|nr:hypothetical protein PHYPA_027906 [Physcomitrium patens]
MNISSCKTGIGIADTYLLRKSTERRYRTAYCMLEKSRIDQQSQCISLQLVCRISQISEVGTPILIIFPILRTRRRVL